jgi:glycosyltransferase involved in cell wall biosynthesis
MHRLCILTQYFPPEMGAPQARLSEMGERLVDLGWQVEVLTALPNYPTGRVFEPYDRRRPVVEQVGRLRAVRVPLFTAQRGFLNRMRCYMSFVQNAKRYGPRLCQRPDLLFVESPPLFIGYAARHLSRRWACPFVFNVSDLWPESAVRIGVVKPGVATWLAERLELKLYRQAAGVTGQSSEIIASVARRAGAVRTAVITNGVDPTRFGPAFADDASRKLVGDEPGPIFVYAGLLGHAQGLDQILDLAAQMPASQPGRFVLAGDGPEREHLAGRIGRESIRRVRLLPAQPRDRVAPLLAACDVAIVTLGMSIPGAVPSKIYEAMASALPILLIADGEAARRVTEAECGFAVAPGDLHGARDAVVRLSSSSDLRQRLGAAGRRAAETTYNRDAIARRLDAFCRSVLPQ